ncbi:MAG: hypothetical protein IH984_13955 [Planctomycetes bacterium]|nr:hypothetical protein [Planctomycetota bacterium]
MIKRHSICSSTLFVMSAVILLVCSAGYGQPFENCPNPAGGNCIEATLGTPGCRFQSCCEFICVSDPMCCEIEWDALCAELGEIQCEFCGPGFGDCLAPNDTPGCEDAACCGIVCDIDPECCVNEWDATCAAQAQNMCICAPGDEPANDDCADAIVIFEGDLSFSTLCATADGPDQLGTPCGQVIDPGLNRDVWYNYIATFTGTARVHTCDSVDYYTEIAVYPGCSCPANPDTLIGCDSAGLNCPGFGAEVIFDVQLGSCYKIRIGGQGPFTGTGFFTVEEFVPVLPPENDNCADALEMVLDSFVIFDNTNATTDGVPNATCDFLNQANIANDIWYDFVAPEDGTYEVSMCGSSFDTKLAVYDGCQCPTPADALVCNDDSCFEQSKVSFIGSTGQCYKIRAGSFPAAQIPAGLGQIVITQLANCPPGNTTLSQNVSDSILIGNSLACLGSVPGTTADNAYARSYDLSVLIPKQAYELSCVVWGIESNNTADVIATINLYEDIDGAMPIAPGKDLVLLGSQSLLVKAGTTQELMLVTFNPPISIDPDIVLVSEIAFPDTDGITGVWVGSNAEDQTAPGYIRSDACGIPTFIDIADIPDCIPCADMHIVNKLIGNSAAPPCPWDLDDNNSVGTSDLLELFAQWGTAGTADFDGSGSVGTADLLILFANWGPCS